MADAVTSVRAIRAADKVTYIDHFGGDSEGPVSTAVLARHFIQNFGRRPMKKNYLDTHTHGQSVKIGLAFQCNGLWANESTCERSAVGELPCDCRD